MNESMLHEELSDKEAQEMESTVLTGATYWDEHRVAFSPRGSAVIKRLIPLAINTHLEYLIPRIIHRLVNFSNAGTAYNLFLMLEQTLKDASHTGLESMNLNPDDIVSVAIGCQTALKSESSMIETVEELRFMKAQFRFMLGSYNTQHVKLSVANKGMTKYIFSDEALGNIVREHWDKTELIIGYLKTQNGSTEVFRPTVDESALRDYLSTPSPVQNGWL